MKALLLTNYGSCLKTRDHRLVLRNQDSGRSREWLPVDFPYDTVVVENLGGFVTFPALRWLAANGSNPLGELCGVEGRIDQTIRDFGVERTVSPFPIPMRVRALEEVTVVTKNLPVVGSIVPSPAPRDDVVHYENANVRNAAHSTVRVGLSS